MSLAISKVPTPVNEPVKSYAPGSPERASLEAKLDEMSANRVDMPLVIAGKDVRTGKLGQAVMPHRHAHVLGDFHQGGAAEVKSAIDAALRAQHDWAALPWEARASVFLKAADLLAGPYRDVLNAATMLGQKGVDHPDAQALDRRQRAGLVPLDEPRIADEVGDQDGGEPSLDPCGFHRCPAQPAHRSVDPST